MCKSKEQLIIEKAEELGHLAQIRKDIIKELEMKIIILENRIKQLEGNNQFNLSDSFAPVDGITNFTTKASNYCVTC